MVKLTLECAIFGFIMFQLISLTSFTNKDGSPVATTIQNVTIAAHDAKPDEVDPFATFMDETTPENAKPKPNTTADTAMQAQLEAMRIVQDGNVDDFVEKVDQNPLAKVLLGL